MDGTSSSARSLPHPVTGAVFASPVPPGAGWPDDVATARTPRARDAAAVERLAATSRTLTQLDARSSVCRACPRLVAWREDVAHTKRRAFAAEPYWGRPAPGLGDPAAHLVIVGLAPAAHGANRTGRLFTGDRSGDWIVAALHRAGYANQPTTEAAGDGLELRGARIVAAVRCAPPDNAPTPDERATCAGWLRRELQLLAPTTTALLALGQVAWQATFAALKDLGWSVPRPRPAFGHGARASVRAPDGREVLVVASYHVSQQNTFTGRLTEAMLDDVLAVCRATGPGWADAETRS
ncbi:Uracil-DNA glycosylase superfamily [Beutenbergia cavernae DSM 12333]|uniref:Type-5 uracil-DNA glycosylase n=1 Tax=Beutenbergia cavernae (strain ATCC BAA-8 / DSM 12333 / CCUG 43141 / JCM 11478 / NBRC 16432 / NCIMB 13614 / HKI 0122) TaxID=471853 RepID=C5C0A3_BEUC1|nr:uracil-DNA glycosylase [Beutenbergia cavernae]ACQ79289.1 Uracil-DNA glycosylase superfamily [Beutenbergia cavernae DSM 12333]